MRKSKIATELPGSRPLLDIEVDADCDEPTEKIVGEIKRHSLRNAVVKLTYKIKESQQAFVREKEIREALSGAFMVVSLHRKVQREGGLRLPMDETMEVRKALGMYIDTKETLKPHRERLMNYAEPLFAELAEEEATH